MTDRLEVTNVSTGYGDIQAIWDLSLEVEPGKATVVLGPNGAGKTTSLMAVMGLLPLWAGSVTWRSKDISNMPPYHRIKHGLALVQEGKRVFKKRTIEENLLLSAYATVRGRSEIKTRLAEQYERFPVLFERRKLAAATLSGGEQQMLAIAQALIPKPAVLILDEPTAGLAPVIVKQLFAQIARLKSEGIGILLVEQVVHQALQLADDVVVLNVGRVAHRAKAEDMTDSSVIEEVYFGARPAARVEPGTPAPAAAAVKD
ncbi:MAG: branched-chain amino acid transport system ATP-binding protein [Chloroflexota bacterium]|jgi:branched-chain amino acid transport system ATP-binding protein|nr:branched-chain amino acid transport system ATP-binding protein [Chloroflexota bacterium]